MTHRRIHCFSRESLKIEFLDHSYPSLETRSSPHTKIRAISLQREEQVLKMTHVSIRRQRINLSRKERAFPLKSVRRGRGRECGKIEENSETYRKELRETAVNRCVPAKSSYTRWKRHESFTGATIEIPKWRIVLHTRISSKLRRKSVRNEIKTRSSRV